MSVLPFATPEIGRAVKVKPWTPDPKDLSDSTEGRALSLVFNLITHRNFYASSKQATLICSGRLLELIVTSLVRDPTWRDIERIQNQPPFHSAAAVASTKPLLIVNDEEEGEDSWASIDSRSGDLRIDVPLRVFLDEISEWRKEYRLHQWGPVSMACLLRTE